MATFSGHITATSILGRVPDEPQAFDYTVPQMTQAGLLTGVRLQGGSPLVNTQPTDLNARTMPGERQRTFFEDFYNTIHFLPALIELGAVSSDTSTVLRIWNAYLSPVTLDAVSFINQAGVTLTGPTVPRTMVPLQTLVYQVGASGAGPATIDTQIVFDFSIGQFSLNVTGTRARVAPFVPNWSKSFEIEYQFKTDLFTSRNGRETRRALRASPRKRVSFTATPSHEKLRRVRNMLAGWHSNTIIMPELPRQASLRAPAEDSNTLYLRTAAPAWVKPGVIVVVSFGQLYEAREVVGVAGDSVQLAGTLPGLWPAGTKLHPGLSVRFADSINVRHATDDVATVGIDLEVIPASEFYVPTAPPRLYKGREVWLTQPNWVDAITDTHLSQREMVDFGSGRNAVFLPVPFATVLQKMTYTGRDFQQSSALVEFFLRSKGQLNEFYMPTFVDDIQFGYVVQQGERTLRVLGKSFYDDLAGDTQRKAVAIFMKNGDVHLRGVNSVSTIDDADGIDSALDLDEALPYDLTLTNVAKISWMPVWRMATDTLTMEWVTNTVGQCQLSVRMLEDLPV